MPLADSRTLSLTPCITLVVSIVPVNEDEVVKNVWNARGLRVLVVMVSDEQIFAPSAPPARLHRQRTGGIDDVAHQHELSTRTTNAGRENRPEAYAHVTDYSESLRCVGRETVEAKMSIVKGHGIVDCVAFLAGCTLAPLATHNRIVMLYSFATDATIPAKRID